MTTSNCRWFPVAVDKVPSYFITGGNALNFNVLMKVADLPADVLTSSDLALAANALITDFVAQGESAEDATAAMEGGTTWVGQEGGKVYVFFDTPAGVYVYVQKCGAAANLPYIIGGAVLAGLGGFAFGYSRKGKKKGVPAYALMGATVGVLAGAAGGYALARLATGKDIKTYEGMGALSVTRRRRFVR